LAQALSLEPSDPEPQDAFALQLHSLRRDEMSISPLAAMAKKISNM
jgi:hypothetical protein